MWWQKLVSVKNKCFCFDVLLPFGIKIQVFLHWFFFSTLFINFNHNNGKILPKSKNTPQSPESQLKIFGHLLKIFAHFHPSINFRAWQQPKQRCPDLPPLQPPPPAPQRETIYKTKVMQQKKNKCEFSPNSFCRTWPS